MWRMTIALVLSTAHSLGSPPTLLAREADPEGAATFRLVPAPRVIENAHGWVRLARVPKVVVAGSLPEEVGIPGLLEDITSVISAASSAQPVRSRAPLIVVRPGISPAPQPWQREEAYSLVVEPDSIVVTSASVRGRFYGVQTLRQLVRASELGRIPTVAIRDYPLIRWRGVMDDISRGQAPARSDFDNLFARLAYYKINTYLLYIEDMARFWSAPSIGVGRGALTPSELRLMVTTAAKHHVTVVPVFQTVGHQQRLLQSAELSPYAEYRPRPPFEQAIHSWLWQVVPALAMLLRIQDPAATHGPLSCFALADPSTAPRVTRLVDELAANVSSPFFHLGGDEPADLGKGASHAEVQRIGIGAVYAAYLNRLIAHVEASLHRVPIVFGDVVLSEPDAMRMLSRRVAVMDWQYDPQASDSTLLRLKAAGFERLFACAGLWNWFSVYPNYARGIPNIAALGRAALRTGVEGFVVASWGDGGARSLRSANWPGFAYGAETAWSGPAPVGEYLSRFASTEYGTADRAVAEAIKLVAWQEFPGRGYSQRVVERPPDVRARSGEWRVRMQQLEADMRAARRFGQKAMASARFNASDLRVLDNAAGQLQLAAGQELVLDSLARRLSTTPWRSLGEKERAHWTDRLSALSDSSRALRGTYALLWQLHNRPPLLEPVLAAMNEQGNAYDALLDKAEHHELQLATRRHSATEPQWDDRRPAR